MIVGDGFVLVMDDEQPMSGMLRDEHGRSAPMARCPRCRHWSYQALYTRVCLACQQDLASFPLPT